MLLTAEIIIIVAAAVLDQVTKKIVLGGLALSASQQKDFIPGLIDFRYVENEGAAFGMLKGCRWLFIVLSFAAIIGMIVYIVVYRKKTHPLTGIAFAMVAGGGIGNQIDRVLRGSVTDFIHFDFDFPVLHDFPCFNVADSFVTVGAILLIVSVIFFDRTLFEEDGKKVPAEDEKVTKEKND